jgi:hypothetical protein
MEKITLADTAWTCGCGSMNSAYRTTCGGCNKLKPESDK